MSTDALVAIAAAELGIPSVCLQQGWASVVHVGLRHMQFDRMAVWGNGFAKLLEPYNLAQQFAVTGNPALDPRLSPHESPIPRLGTGRQVLFSLQTVTPMIPAAAMSSFIDLIARIATDCPGTTLLVREHPGHPISRGAFEWSLDAPNLMLVPPEKYALRDVLEASDIVVAITSTTLLEGIALGKPAVVYNCTPLPRYSPDVELWGAGAEVREIETAVTLVQRLLKDDAFYRSFEPGIVRFRDEFFHGLDGEAAKRVARLFDDVKP